MRAVTVVSWRGRIPQGKMESPVAIIDWLPTLAGLSGATPAADEPLDGVDIWPLLSGFEKEPAPRTLFWRSPASSAVRKGKWKLVTAPGDPFSLYDIDSDPSEKQDLSDTHPGRLANLQLLLAEKEAAEADPRREF